MGPIIYFFEMSHYFLFFCVYFNFWIINQCILNQNKKKYLHCIIIFILTFSLKLLLLSDAFHLSLSCFFSLRHALYKCNGSCPFSQPVHLWKSRALFPLPMSSKHTSSTWALLLSVSFNKSVQVYFAASSIYQTTAIWPFTQRKISTVH